MKLLRPSCATMAVFLCFIGGTLRAKAVFDATEGYYTDDFSDNSGISLEQNIKVGHPLIPGVKVSLLEWCWGQPYLDEDNSLYTQFSDPGATHNLTQTFNETGEPADEKVRLWQEEFLAGSQLVLDPSVSTTTVGPRRARLANYAYRPAVEELNGQFMARGPYQTGLLSRQEYTATFKSFYCDDPGCVKESNPADMTGVDIATLDVFHGIRLASYDLKLRGYNGGQCGTGGGFACEYSNSPVSLEFKIPDPIPAWKGYEYRVQISMSETGAVSCSPFCTATLWLDSLKVMAKGRPILAEDYVCTGDCAPGERPCGPICVPVELPCGADTATYFAGAGTYLSPVFDSLSENTIWSRIAWNVDQQTPTIKPKAPIGIKWRVGNSPDPATWLANPLWFTWTLPMRATDVPGDCPEQPGIMPDDGSTSLYAEGDPAKALTGRYFQYAVDFTGQYANERYPPEADSPSARQLHDAVGPDLNAMKVCYTPSAGRIISNTVCASQLRNWRMATYETDVSTGGRVQVDVLDQNNVPLFANIPAQFSLTGLDPKEYPCLRLRATIDNEGDPNKRPRLLSWRLEWDVISTPLQLDRNSISLKAGGAVTITIVLPVMLEGALTVHDVTGQLIKEIGRGPMMAGLNNWSWDGTNHKGHAVAPGVYFVTLNAGDIRQVRTLAVVP